MFYRKFISVGSCVASLALTACGPSANLAIKGIDLSTSQINQDTYINMEAIVSLGNLKLPGIQVPVYNPKTNQEIGSLSMAPLADGTNQVNMSVDFSVINKLDATLGTSLPNGREIPTALGATGATLVGVNVLTNSRIYVGGDVDQDLYAGAAISIPAFGSVMANVPIPLNIFFSFPFSSQITGVGGLFTSPIAAQNGIGIFVKKTAPTPAQPTGTTQLVLKTTTADQTQQAQAEVASGKSELNQVDTLTLYQLNHLFNKRATVKVK